MVKNYNFSNGSFLFINQCYDREFKPNHVSPNIHVHMGFEIMYVVYGNCKVEFFDRDESSPREDYALSMGDFIFLESDDYHRLSVSKTGARILNIQVSPAKDCGFPSQKSFNAWLNFEPVITEFFNAEPATFRLYDDGAVFESLFLLVKRYNPEPSQAIMLEALLQVLLTDVARLYGIGRKRYKGNIYLKKAIFEIENNIRSVNAKSILEKLKISRSYLQQIFKDNLGTGVTEYITKCKISRAQNYFAMLPSMKVADVAQELGYSRFVFERTFKRVTGITPSECVAAVKASSNKWTYSPIILSEFYRDLYKSV